MTSDDKVGGWVKKGQNHDDVILEWSQTNLIISHNICQCLRHLKELSGCCINWKYRFERLHSNYKIVFCHIKLKILVRNIEVKSYHLHTKISFDLFNVLFTLNRTTHSSKTLLRVVRFNVNKTLGLISILLCLKKDLKGNI